MHAVNNIFLSQMNVSSKELMHTSNVQYMQMANLWLANNHLESVTRVSNCEQLTYHSDHLSSFFVCLFNAIPKVAIFVMAML